MEREIRKAKRKVEGFTDPENVAMAKAQLKEKQKQLREFIDKTNADEGAEVLRRDSGREKIYKDIVPKSAESNRKPERNESLSPSPETKPDAPQATQEDNEGNSSTKQNNAVQSSTEAVTTPDNVNNKSVDKGAKSGIIKLKEVRDVTISAIESPIEQQHTGKGNPNAILTFDVELTNRQKDLLEMLPEFDSQVVIPRDSVNMADLSALTAKTGHEFAMFTKGGERLIVRGNEVKVNINLDDAKRLSSQGYRWSGHTHPGIDFLCMQPSDGDYSVLDCFKQENSVIYNSKGDFRTFEKRGE